MNGFDDFDLYESYEEYEEDFYFDGMYGEQEYEEW